MGDVTSYTLVVGASSLCSITVQGYDDNGRWRIVRRGDILCRRGGGGRAPGVVASFSAVSGAEEGTIDILLSRIEGATGYRVRYDTANVLNPSNAVDLRRRDRIHT